MTTRAKLIAKINTIEDDTFLKAILQYLEDYEKDPIILSSQDKQSINISEEQIANNQFITQSDLDIKVSQWLAK